jgi:hypothetical protein
VLRRRGKRHEQATASGIPRAPGRNRAIRCAQLCRANGHRPATVVENPPRAKKHDPTYAKVASSVPRVAPPGIVAQQSAVRWCGGGGAPPGLF